MNEITQHIPSFVETRAPPTSCEFQTLAELEAIPFVKAWKENPNFVRFSLSDDCLMAEMVGEFWVVGYLKDPSSIDLPQWKRP